VTEYTISVFIFCLINDIVIDNVSIKICDYASSQCLSYKFMILLGKDNISITT